MNKLTDILDYLWEDAQQPDTGSGKWKPDRISKAEAAINKHISEIIGPDYTLAENALPTQFEVEKVKELNRLLARQRKAAGITVDGDKA